MRPPLQVTDVHWRQKVRLQQMYQETDCPRTRVRVQMVLLSVEEYSVSKIAGITRQSDDTVRRWLHRFRERGCAGLLEEIHSGRPANITPAIEDFLLTCLKQSPRKFGISRPTWTTATLAEAVEKKFKIEVSDECVRQHLQRLEIVCRRPTWTVKPLAEQQPGYAQKKAQFQGF
jgi:transposase